MKWIFLIHVRIPSRCIYSCTIGRYSNSWCCSRAWIVSVIGCGFRDQFESMSGRTIRIVLIFECRKLTFPKYCPYFVFLLEVFWRGWFPAPMGATCRWYPKIGFRIICTKVLAKFKVENEGVLWCYSIRIDLKNTSPDPGSCTYVLTVCTSSMHSKLSTL